MKSGVRCGWTPQCKCGWIGTTFYGAGSRSGAWDEYRHHKQRTCPLTQEETANEAEKAQ